MHTSVPNFYIQVNADRPCGISTLLEIDLQKIKTIYFNPYDKTIGKDVIFFFKIAGEILTTLIVMHFVSSLISFNLFIRTNNFIYFSLFSL